MSEILALEQLAEGRFTWQPHTTRPGRIFGGQTLGQAIMAAGLTVPEGRSAHSAHGRFLNEGDNSLAVDYVVDAVRDGGSFSIRNVRAVQADRDIFTLTASFHRGEVGLHHQVPKMPSQRIPEPTSIVEDTLDPVDLEAAMPWLARLKENRAVEFRFPDEFPRFAVTRGEVRPPHQKLWIRAVDQLNDDPLVHASAVGYMSDMFLMSSALPPHGLTFDDGRVNVVSLDHAIWLHAGTRADEWHLYEQEGRWAGRGRGLAQGHIFNGAGELVATTMQEGLLRFREQRTTPILTN